MLLHLSLLLALLSQCQTETPDTEAEQLTIIPFEYHQGLIIIQVEIGGKSYPFLLDSGVSYSILSPDMAESLKLRTLGKDEIEDTYRRRREVKMSLGPALRIGNMSFSPEPVRLVDVSHSFGLHDLRIVGIIGANTMRRAYWQIDFARRRIYLFNNEALLPDQGQAQVLSLELGRVNQPYIDLMVGTQRIDDVLVDLGYNGDLELPMSEMVELERQGRLSGIKMRDSAYGILGDNQADSVLVAVDSDFDFGGRQLRAVIKGRERATPKIGTGLLQQFLLTFDWHRRRLYLEPARLD